MDHILFVQYGDFRDAYRRFSDGHAETYRDQKKSVDFVSALARDRKVTVLAIGGQTYWQDLTPNLQVCGFRRQDITAKAVSDIYERVRATHLVLRTPHTGFLKEAARRKIKVLPSFADIFQRKGPRQAWHNFKLRRALLSVQASCICNHSLNASRSLVSVLGLPQDRVVAWDWSRLPLAGPAKAGIADPRSASAFFAGALTEDKGLGDCLQAAALLSQTGITLTLSVAGQGDLAMWQRRVQDLGLAGQINFLGTIPNTAVRERMRDHDFVLVPSRHSYGEGLPNTIYEALASRSVLVMSDHPAFEGRLKDRKECLIFKASDPSALARTLQAGIENRDLYARISDNAAQAHDNLYVGLEWSTLVTTFLNDPDDRTKWVRKNSLAAIDPTP